MRTKASPKPLVGLDIEPGGVVAVQVDGSQELRVLKVATAPLEPGVVRDGEVINPESLTATLKQLFAAHKLPRRVRLGVANQRIVVRTVDMPPLSDAKELEAAVRFGAQDHIPMPLDQAVLEYQSLGQVETPEGPRSRVVLVAARRDMVARLLSAVRAAGLKPEGIDLSAFALIRALSEQHAPGEAVLYLSVSGMTNLALAENGRCLFTRVVPGGTELVAQSLAERRGLTLEHAHGWLSHVGLDEPVEEIDGDTGIVLEARSVLTEGVRRIADDLRNSLDFYRMQEQAVPVSRAVLTGPAAAIPGFAGALAAEIGMPVAEGGVRAAHEGALGSVHAARMTVAAGLAVEERAA